MHRRSNEIPTQNQVVMNGAIQMFINILQPFNFIVNFKLKKHIITLCLIITL